MSEPKRTLMAEAREAADRREREVKAHEASARALRDIADVMLARYSDDQEAKRAARGPRFFGDVVHGDDVE